MVELFKEPERAHTIVAKAGADSARDLAYELRRLAEMIERGELTTGCSGSPSGGAVYSYRVSPMTHDAYFEAIAEALSAESA